MTKARTSKHKALVCEGCKKETGELERYQGWRLCVDCIGLRRTLATNEGRRQ